MGPDEFVNLVGEHDAKMRALAYRMIQQRDDTDDVLQEAYLRAFKGLARYREEARFETWLYRIVYNTCLNHLSTYRPHENIDSAIQLASASDVSGSAARSVDVSAALRTLPPQDRAAVLLIDIHELTYSQAAEVMETPEGTVASRVGRARRLLRERLQMKEAE